MVMRNLDPGCDKGLVILERRGYDTCESNEASFLWGTSAHVCAHAGRTERSARDITRALRHESGLTLQPYGRAKAFRLIGRQA